MTTIDAMNIVIKLNDQILAARSLPAVAAAGKCDEVAFLVQLREQVVADNNLMCSALLGTRGAANPETAAH